MIVLLTANLFLQIPLLGLALAYVGVILFTVILIYDIQQVVNGGEDNYVWATVSIYLDLANLFLNLVQIALSLVKD